MVFKKKKIFLPWYDGDGNVLTGRTQWRFHFWSWSNRLDWSGLFGCQFLQTDTSLLEHLLNRALLLENSLYLVLYKNRKNSNVNCYRSYIKARERFLTDQSTSS